MKASILRLNRLFIVLFIVAYFILAIGWSWICLPEPLKPTQPLYNALHKLLYPLVTLTGLEQNWTLFAPKVIESNTYNLILITKRDGLLKLYEPPRMEKMNYIQKLQNEKYRKLFMDNLPNLKYSFIRPSLSRFFVRNNYQPQNPPTRLAFFLVGSPIPPPKPSSSSPLQANLSPSIENYCIYGVSPEDFQ